MLERSSDQILIHCVPHVNSSLVHRWLSACEFEPSVGSQISKSLPLPPIPFICIVVRWFERRSC